MDSASSLLKSSVEESELKKECKEEKAGNVYNQPVSCANLSSTRFIVSDGELPSKQLHLLRHPKSGNATLYAIGSERVEELLRFDDGFRSVLLGNNVVSNGSLILLAPVNPALLLLPYLRKYAQEDYVSLKDVLVDDRFPSIKLLENVKAVKSSLKHACHCKEMSNIEKYKYNESLLVDYIMNKMKLTIKSDSSTEQGVCAILEENLPDDILRLIKIDSLQRGKETPSKKRRMNEDLGSKEKKGKITGNGGKPSQFAAERR